MDLYQKGFMIGVAALFALALYWMLAPLWGALAWGICLAFLLAPVHRSLTRKLKGRAVVYGEIMTALVQGTLVGIGFAIAGLPSAIVFGVLAALLALLPVGGAAIVWVPAVIFLVATSQWGWAFFMLIWGTGVSVSDNLMRPFLISTQAPVSTLVVFIGVIGGISAFGMIGVIIGPVLLTVLATLLRFLDETLSHQP